MVDYTYPLLPKISTCTPYYHYNLQDASLEGWEATDSISTSGAPWQDTDELMHINVLELTAAHLALTKLAKAARSTHIQLKMDNLTAIAYINKMGGTHSPECNHVSQKIWEWAIA